MGHSRILWILYTTIALLSPLRAISDSCESKSSCGECIQSSSCYWCLDPDPIWEEPRCLEISELSVSQCSPENVFNPENNHTVNDNVKNATSVEIFQTQEYLFNPQNITVKLRQGKPYVIQFDYNHISRWNSLVSSVEMINEYPENVQVKISCLDNRGLPANTSKCDSSFSFGNIYHFQVELKLLNCIETGNGTIKINPMGISENLIINLEPLCNCPCEDSGDSQYVENAPQCNHHGTLKCGSCLCDTAPNGTKFSGNTCECLENEKTANACLAVNSTEICSGRGSCSCGRCICDEYSENGSQITGTHCEIEESPEDITQDETEVLLADQQMPQLEEDLIEEFQDHRTLQQRAFSVCSAATCRECIKSSGCSWCSDPSLQSKQRCLVTSPYTQCAKEFLYKPQPLQTILSSPSYTPDRLKIIKRSRIQIPPNQQAEFLFEYTHTDTRGLFLTISGAKQITARLFVKCGDYDSGFTETNRCNRVRYHFTAQVKVVVNFPSCESVLQSNWNQNITVRPAGSNEVALIDLELICECPCEKQSSQFSRICNDRGAYKCGVCECYPGFTGSYCQTAIVQSTCRPFPQSTLDCSGRGKCHLGKCVCSRGYSGTYCEKLRARSLLPQVRSFLESEESVDSAASPYEVQVPMDLCISPYNQLSCSGVGNCYDGICQCSQGFEGEFCEKPVSASDRQPYYNPCLDPRDNRICSNVGSCRNDICECPPERTGTYCEIDERGPAASVLPIIPVAARRDPCLSPRNNKICSERGECRYEKCVCFQGFYGEFCDQYDVSPTPSPLIACIAPGSSVNCSNRGWCINDECQCASDRTGQYCEREKTVPSQEINGCVNRADNKVCSGIGRCRNNRCECPPDKLGTFCENSYYPRPTPPPTPPTPRPTTHPCLSPLNNRICSDRGECRNNRCTCSEYYSGQFCSDYNPPSIPRPPPVNPCISPGSNVECSGRGWCRNNRCECTPEITGQYCDQRKPTPSVNPCLSSRTNTECAGRGTCYNNTCTCHENFSGRHCEDWITVPTTSVNRCYSPRSRLECSGAGYCHNGRCVCNPGFDGDFCEPGQIVSTSVRPSTSSQACLSPYNRIECSGQGLCRNNVCECYQNYAGQYCETLSPVRDLCTNPQTRQICSNNGQCRENRCVCAAEYTGQYCEQPNTQCVDPRTGFTCSGNGQCYNGKCICNHGVTGPLCEYRLTQSESSCSQPGTRTNCSGIGRCNQGTCLCPLGYSGIYCEKTPTTAVQDPCLSPYNQQECSGRGRCHEGKCRCTGNFAGTFCQNSVQIQPATSTPVPYRNPCVYPNDRIECSGRGVCQQNRCLCRPGHQGQYCQDRIPPSTPPPQIVNHCVNPNGQPNEQCSRRGECLNDSCRCQQYFSGTYCEVYQSQSPSPIPTNDCINPSTNQECSGQGRCLNDRCGCFFQFTGRYCEVRTNNATENFCRSSPNDQYECSGQGRCRNGRCECYEPFGGTFCDIDMEAVTDPPPEINFCLDPYSKEECSRVGRCVNNRCQCPSGYSGQYCEQEPTASYCKPPWDSHDCSQRGRCISGRCECLPQFTGEFCDTPVTSISNNCRSGGSNLDCNGRGTCLNDQCRCDQGYEGRFCEVARPSPGLDRCLSPYNNISCSGRGVCMEDRCQCYPEFSGEFCQNSVVVTTPNPQINRCVSPYNGAECSGSGRCSNDRCLCYSGYTGSYCEASVDVPQPPPVSDAQCVNPANNAICSGRGNCIGGYCQCEVRRDSRELITGRYCECDNYSCNRINGLLCAGRGSCECGQCRCSGDWTGPDCGCPRSNSTCRHPNSTPDVVCSAHGDCDCGLCKCQPGYSGQYCEQVSTASRPPPSQDNCWVHTTCGECLESPTCAWCQDPTFREARCMSSSNPSPSCLPEFIIDPVNSMLVMKAQPLLQGSNGAQPTRALINPQKIALKLRPHQPLQVSMHYSHKLKFFVHAQPAIIYLDHNATNAINVKFYTTCLNPNSQFRETNQCENVKVGDLIPFKIDLEVLQCPPDPRNRKQVIEIVPRGHDENLILEVELLCDCSCDKPGDVGYVENAQQCSYRGTFECGVCQCHPNFEGPACERMKTSHPPPYQPPSPPPSTTSSYYPQPSPRPPPTYYPPDNTPNSPTYGCYYPGKDKECLGNGLCVGGRCQCQAPFTGTFCQDRTPDPSPQLDPRQMDCRSKRNCSECTRDPTCSWCKDNFSCLPTASATSYCRSLYNPESAIDYITPSSTSSISPDYISVVLRPGQPLGIPIEYKSKFNPTPWGRPFTVELAVNHSRYVYTKLLTHCLNQNGPIIETNSCDNVNLQDVIKFEVEVGMAGTCPQEEEEWLQKIQIHRVGMNDSLTIEVEFLCECSCDETGAVTEIQSPRCSYHGSLSCGECDCDEGYAGVKCETKFNDDEDVSSALDATCVSRNDGQICSGRGTCLNGRCRCAVGWEGEFCSYPESACVNPHNNQVCSGSGTCSNGACRCSPGFTGRFCESCNSIACLQQQQNSQRPHQQALNFKDLQTSSEACSGFASCDKCIENAACSWCLDSNSCFGRGSSSGQCRPESVFDPQNWISLASYNASSADIDVGVSQILPERVNVTLRPGKPLRFVIEYTHGIFPFNNPSSVELQHSNPYGINVKFYSSCLNNQPLTETGRCDNLQTRSKVRFIIELEAKSCPKNPYDWQQTIEIQPLRIPTVMSIDVTLLCNCGCPASDIVQNAIECLQHGNLKCGRCECHPGYSGSNCQNTDSQLEPLIVAAELNRTGDSICGFKSSCHDCIQTAGCAWCSDPALMGRRRCFDPQITTPQGDQCRDEYVHNPENEMQIVSSNSTQLYARGRSNDNYQRLHVKLRVGERFMIPLFYNHQPSANSWFISSVELGHSASRDVNVRMFTNCLNPDQPLMETSRCSNLRHPGLIEFNVEILLRQCPQDKRDWRETFNISPTGSKENFIIDLEMICDCPCETLDRYDYGNVSMECNQRGTYVCGLCECNRGFSGVTCEHYTAQTLPPLPPLPQPPLENQQVCSNSVQTCFDPSSNLLCSGHGTCNCGQCACERGYTGRYCDYCQGCNQTSLSIEKPSSSYEQCSSRTSCDACIQTASCAWCSDPTFRAPYKCFQYANQSIYQCREEYVTNPTNNVTVLDVGNVKEVYAHLNEHQVFPKKLTLQLRPNAPQLINIAVVVPENVTVSPYLHMLFDSRGFLKVRYFTKCQTNVQKETSKCSSVQPGSMISFTVAIELLQCPRDNREWKQKVRIYPSGSMESLSIDLSMLCDCSCSRDIEQAPQCNYHGAYKCGKCECDPYFAGANCELQQLLPPAPVLAAPQVVCPISQEGCRNPLGRSPEERRICSGRGECNCDTCSCQRYFMGSYCETYCPTCT